MTGITVICTCVTYRLKRARFNHCLTPQWAICLNDFKMVVILELRMWNGDIENDINKADNHN